MEYTAQQGADEIPSPLGPEKLLNIWAVFKHFFRRCSPAAATFRHRILISQHYTGRRIAGSCRHSWRKKSSQFPSKTSHHTVEMNDSMPETGCLKRFRQGDHGLSG